MSFHLLYVQARVPALPLKDEGFVYLILILTPCTLMVGLNQVDSCHCLGIKGFQAPENFNGRDYEALNGTTENLLPLRNCMSQGSRKRRIKSNILKQLFHARSKYQICRKHRRQQH
ncbi:uncharacterized protein LOC103834674 isoform X1 [Brassica rapa]|uniref:uncharacterized protein LOC103834674 isoform X1 n=1 Tax=Brassica campestris TaxID=3711 RepID=UPI0004F1B3D9|nr:uncharacterized protein LOC103834674 isoform X1 [Brassica rapa]